MSFSGLEKAYSVPSCLNTSYCSGVSCAFHSASVLDTFLIPLDFVFSCGSVPSPIGRECGSTAFLFIIPPSLGRAQLGSRDNIARPPTAIEDETKKRLFMVSPKR